MSTAAKSPWAPILYQFPLPVQIITKQEIPEIPEGYDKLMKNGETLIVSADRKWNIKNMTVFHVTGVDTQITIRNNNTDVVLWLLVIPAASATSTVNIPLPTYSTPFELFTGDRIQFVGDATNAWLSVRYLEYKSTIKFQPRK